VVLRLLALKHMFHWSYDEMQCEVRANLVYREFTRIGGGKVPDDKTMGRLARQLGPEPVEKLHQRLVAIARDKKIIEGRKLRVDTTVVASWASVAASAVIRAPVSHTSDWRVGSCAGQEVAFPIQIWPTMLSRVPVRT
jgi:hypothetical protein